MFCKFCGKELCGDESFCPYCGGYQGNRTIPVDQPSIIQKGNVYSRKAHLSKVFGLLSVLILAPFGIPAIVLSSVSMSETGGVRNREAKTGLALGIIGLTLWGVCFLIWFCSTS